MSFSQGGKVDVMGHISVRRSLYQRIVLVNPAQVTGEDQAVFIVRLYVAMREAGVFQKSK